jgi:hypothetical protein
MNDLTTANTMTYAYSELRRRNSGAITMVAKPFEKEPDFKN